MSRKYYSCKYRLNRTDAFLIWFSNEKDGVITDAAGAVICFASKHSIEQFALREELRLQFEEPALYDFDLVLRWAASNGRGPIDCSLFLNVWNLLGDISRSVGGDFDPNLKQTKKLYDKLFWACNLPAVTPVGRKFKPTWSQDDRCLLCSVLSSGIKCLRSHLAKTRKAGILK